MVQRTRWRGRGERVYRGLGVLAAISIVLAGCASRGQEKTVGAAAEAAPSAVVRPHAPEDEVLPNLSTLGVDRPMLLSNGVSARAETTYFAASGRRCRAVYFLRDSGTPDRRLACQDGARWNWVPNVLP